MPTNQVNTPGLSIVLPAYNEENGIMPTLEQLRAIMQVYPDLDYQIIVVDDGSIDRTAEILADAQGIDLVVHQTNRGYGASLKTGIRRARFKTICITDADGTYPNDRIPEFYRLFNDCRTDMLVGARIGDNVHIPAIRKPAKKTLNCMADYVAGTHIPDLNSGLRLFDRATVMKFFSILPDGFSFTTTITLAMLTNGYHVQYEKIDYAARVGASKIKPIRDTLNFTMLIFRIALYFAPLKVFLPAAAMLIALGFTWAMFSWTWLGRLADTSSLVIVTTGLQVGLLGLLAELINRRLPGWGVEDPTP